MSDSEWVIVDRALCLTEDRARVVPDTDPRARWLHWPKGTRILKAEYDRLYKPVETVELPKQAAPAPNKSRKPTSNK